MLTEADDRLRGWLGEIAGDVPVTGLPPDAAPGDEDGEPVLAAHLLAIEPAAALTGELHRPGPVVAHLRYVLTSRAADEQAALELLDRVLTGAVDAPVPGIDLDLAPLPVDVWQALGARPRAAVCVRVTARHAPPATAVSLVREPLRVVGAGLRPLRGRVLGNGDIPLAAAEVIVVGTRVSTTTSNRGAFSFAAVPEGPGPIRLAVRAKGRVFTADVEPVGDEPVVMHCDLLEA